MGKAWKGVDERVAGADGLRGHAGGGVAGEGVLEDGDLAIEHGDVEHLAAAAALAFVEGAEDADGGEEAGGDVAEGEAGPDGRAAFFAGDAHDAAHALDDDIEGGLSR